MNDLEIYTVATGLRGAGLLDIKKRGVSEVINFLKSQGLHSVVDKINPEWLTLPTTCRQTMDSEQVYRIYYAKSKSDALAAWHADKARLVKKLGLMLGYPNCCVDFCCEFDRAYDDPLFKLPRQTNLVSKALKRSTQFHPYCNILLRNYASDRLTDSCLLAHYPCSFTCKRSIDYAANLLSLLEPSYADSIHSFLSGKSLYWDDERWPPNFWGEFNGIHFPLAIENHSYISTGIILGNTKTPAGELPSDPTNYEISEFSVNIEHGGGQVKRFSCHALGTTYELFWTAA